MIEYYEPESEPSVLIARGISLLQRGRVEVRRLQDEATPEFDWTPPVVIPRKGFTNAERFDSFHAANPWVFDNIVKLAYQLLRDDARIGMKDIFETLRKKYARYTKTEAHPNGQVYGLDNSFTFFYSRMLTDKHPVFIGHIEQRKRITA